MTDFVHRTLPDRPTTTAPDGSAIRVLVQVDRGSMIHIELAGGAVSRAIAHRSVAELWYIVSGRGEMWRRGADREAVVPLRAGDSLSIPVGTHFQFRALGSAPLRAVAVTMPPWPGEHEAVFVEGIWPTAASQSPHR